MTLAVLGLRYEPKPRHDVGTRRKASIWKTPFQETETLRVLTQLAKDGFFFGSSCEAVRDNLAPSTTQTYPDARDRP